MDPEPGSGPADRAIIASGTVSLTGEISVATIDFSGGTISGTNSLTVAATGSLTLSGTAGQTIALQATEELVGATWSNINTAVDAPFVILFDVPDVADFPERFFRTLPVP